MRRLGARLRSLGFAALAVVAVAAVLLLVFESGAANAGSVPLSERIDGEPFVVEATAYCDTGVTASGHPTVEGLTLAGPEEWMGCAAVIWLANDDGTMGEYLGIYQFTDTGGDARIKSGQAIDIYMPSGAECIEWGRRNVYVQIIDGVG